LRILNENAEENTKI
jgi:hypothetical protein